MTVSEPIQMKNGFSGISTGSSSGKSKPQPQQSNVSTMFGDLQAASELSLDELAKQSDLLENIDKNTRKGLTSGGQTPTTEEEIKTKLSGDEDLTKEQGNKMIKLLEDLGQKSGSLLTFMAAAAGAAAATADEDTQKSLGKAGAGAAALAGGGLAARAIMQRKPIPAGDKEDKGKRTSKQKPKSSAKPRTVPPKVNAKAGKGVAKSAVKAGGTFAAKQAAKVGAIAASGPAAPIVGAVLAASTVYELGTMALEEAGYGDQVEAFETGAINAIGIKTDDQKLEDKKARVEIGKKKMDALVKKVNASDLSKEEKDVQIRELETAAENISKTGNRRNAKMNSNARKTFSKYEDLYGEVDLTNASTPPPSSASQIEDTSSQAKKAEASLLAPQVNIPQQPAPNVNVPPQPAPNISVSAVLPRTNMPDNYNLTGSQSRIPRLIVG